LLIETTHPFIRDKGYDKGGITKRDWEKKRITRGWNRKRKERVKITKWV
jgi:hypothetical protein